MRTDLYSVANSTQCSVVTSIVPLLTSCYGFSFVLGCGVSFFVRFQHPPIDGCPTASCDFGILKGEGELMSFYSAILISLKKKDICIYVADSLCSTAETNAIL